MAELALDAAVVHSASAVPARGGVGTKDTKVHDASGIDKLRNGGSESIHVSVRGWKSSFCVIRDLLNFGFFCSLVVSAVLVQRQIKRDLKKKNDNGHCS